MIRSKRSGAIGRAALPVALLATACSAAVACGGENTITSAWRKVDSCLEEHPSFVGNVVVEKGGPGDAIDALSVFGSGGALANAYRFPSLADARSAEQGIGPPGPTVTFYGNVALEVNASTSQHAGGAIDECFDNVYGNAATATAASTPTASNTSTAPTTTTGGAASRVNSAPRVANLRPCAGQVSGAPKDLSSTTPDCWFANAAYYAVREAYQQTGQIPPQVELQGDGPGPRVPFRCTAATSANQISCTDGQETAIFSRSDLR